MFAGAWVRMVIRFLIAKMVQTSWEDRPPPGHGIWGRVLPPEAFRLVRLDGKVAQLAVAHQAIQQLRGTGEAGLGLAGWIFFAGFFRKCWGLFFFCGVANSVTIYFIFVYNLFCLYITGGRIRGKALGHLWFGITGSYNDIYPKMSRNI